MLQNLFENVHSHNCIPPDQRRIEAKSPGAAISSEIAGPLSGYCGHSSLAGLDPALPCLTNCDIRRTAEAEADRLDQACGERLVPTQHGWSP